MNNILIPSMGKSLFFKDSFFPKPMIEIEGKTMLEQVVENFFRLEDKHFVFVFDKKDCAEFHLDDSARILTGNDTDIVILGAQTAGALCTCLMAIQSINNNEPLIITNCDQTIDVDYNDVLKHFSENDVDAGVITFDSIHPRWSYAKIIDGEVVEVAEKRPLSKHAIAGFYYFKKGRDFVEAAKKVILKDNNYNGNYYISASLNEIILDGGKVGFYEVARDQYNTFYSPEKIKEYEDKRRF
ncbi:Nucleotidyl transferase [Butyrivibrio sp. Su6]|uniref:glycosyltransferase family 2 protein n=1 Tax=Butyrivibrio sp. Su6 TaxID=1520810 RepID=UPI00089F42A8|nr:glycosyltransferase family 2 protein [Butyrivibrio sp. Su6]SEF67304.1 Nucleotidyl transferase [Butyrivibrio sp. Su6]